MTSISDKHIEMQQKYTDNAKHYLMTHACKKNMQECDCLLLRQKYGYFPEEIEA